MNGSPSTVISEGFGLFGSVNLLLTDGFGNGVALPSPGGFVCGTAGFSPRVAGAAALSPRVAGAAALEECE